MTHPEEFDQAAAHKRFSNLCFNETWTLIDKKDRTKREDQLMLATTQASIYHWMQRPDCDDQRLSVGFWQCSRVHALLGNAQEALRQAQVCLSYSGSLEPFFKAYAHEAIARAEALAGNKATRDRHLAQAKDLSASVADAEDRKLLEDDLRNIGG